jgi:hypothetical protein
MAESYGNFPGITTTVRITGLDLAMKYNFTFFASSTDTRNINGVYTVNGKSAILNASLNRLGTVTIYDVMADENGDAVITVSAAPGSEFGLLGALVIDAFKENITNTPLPAGKIMVTGSGIMNLNVEPEKQAGIYPNPFSDAFNIIIPSTGNENVDVRIYDINGKAVHYQRVSSLVKGNNTIRVQPPATLQGGIYQVVIAYLNRNKNTLKSFKVIKQ